MLINLKLDIFNTILIDKDYRCIYLMINMHTVAYQAIRHSTSYTPNEFMTF